MLVIRHYYDFVTQIGLGFESGCHVLVLLVYGDFRSECGVKIGVKACFGSVTLDRNKGRVRTREKEAETMGKLNLK